MGHLWGLGFMGLWVYGFRGLGFRVSGLLGVVGFTWCSLPLYGPLMGFRVYGFMGLWV